MTTTHEPASLLDQALRAVGNSAQPISSATAALPALEVPLTQLPDACAALVTTAGARLATMVGVDDRPRAGAFRLAYVFALAGGFVSLESTVLANDPVFPAVTPVLPAAHWYEREVHDLLGLRPEGHYDLRRLVLHDDWPAGVHPLRKDFDPHVPVPRAADYTHRFHHLDGDGIVEIPVGPIHAGVIEPGHFRFAAVGELVLHLETRLFYTHRGVEKLCEGMVVGRALQVAERVCGACACSHAVSFCQAVESIAGTPVPPRAAAVRTLLLELERLYNHVGDLGNICGGVGFAVGASHGARLKETLQRLNERVTGNRFLRGVCVPGGVRLNPDAATLHDIVRTLIQVAADFERFVEVILGTESVTERFAGTGAVSPEVAEGLGAVGVAARAAGVDRDARRDHPHAAYAGLPLTVATTTSGDVAARVRVRIDETRTAVRLIGALVERMPRGSVVRPLGNLPPYTTGIGVTESPRGENVHWLRTDAEGHIDRYRVRSASYPNWPVVAAAVPGNMVPDFPLINKSFELCYACLDR
jgi:Ni,Fe-hydrogenase III large subunit/Ni,Fe-hydrogenase III component G